MERVPHRAVEEVPLVDREVFSSEADLRSHLRTAATKATETNSLLLEAIRSAAQAVLLGEEEVLFVPTVSAVARPDYRFAAL